MILSVGTYTEPNGLLDVQIELQLKSLGNIELYEELQLNGLLVV